LIAAFFDIIVWLCITSIPSKKTKKNESEYKNTETTIMVP